MYHSLGFFHTWKNKLVQHLWNKVYVYLLLIDGLVGLTAGWPRKVKPLHLIIHIFKTSLHIDTL